MSVTSDFALLADLPSATVLVGPDDWEGAGDLLLEADASSLSAVLPAEGQPTGVIVLLHGGHLNVAAGPAAAAECLEVLRDLPRDTLPVLLFDEMSGSTCARLFRCGLFDALQVPASPQRWNEVLDRADRRLSAIAQRRSLLKETAATSRLLREHRERLAMESAQVGERLAATQERLELVNRELTDHMAQLSLLYKFGRELSSAANWDRTLENILENLSGFVCAAGAALVLRPAPDAPFSPRRTFCWEDSTWDKINRRLEVERQRRRGAGEPLSGAFTIATDTTAEDGSAAPVTALPLEYQDICLGYLMLLDFDPAAGGERFMPFLQAVQVIIAEEVASAQMLDRMRELGTFNSRVLESVRSGIWVVDAEGRTIYCNRAGREMLTGISHEPKIFAEPRFGIGRGREGESDSASASFFRREAFCLDAMPELLLDGVLRLDGLDGPLLSALRNVADGRHQGEGGISAAGEDMIPVMAHTSVMPGRGDGESWLVVVLEDLRETRKLEAERRRADNLQGLVEMSATLAHEIRNPLRGLSAQAEQLAENLEPGDKRARYIDVITDEVGRINDTITRMLHFVRPYEPRRESARLPKLVRDCLDLAAPRAATKSLVLDAEFEPGDIGDPLWALDLDAAQIKQVLLNLVLNACDAAPHAGSVKVRVQCSGQLTLAEPSTGSVRLAPGASIEVIDDGSGIAEGEEETIFRPFYTTKAAGTGLGLSLCRKIIEAHGGTVVAANESAGTVFRVLLPRSIAVSSSKQAQESS